MTKILIKTAILFFMIALVGCQSQRTPITASSETKRQPISLVSSDTTAIWNKFQHNSLMRLQEIKDHSADPNEKAWAELAIISKENSQHAERLAQALLAWRVANPKHPGNQLFPDENTLKTAIAKQKTPARIAVLLPQQGTYASLGKMVREGFLNAYYAQLTHLENQTVKFYDTSGDDNLLAVYQKAKAEGADMIIGPLTKEDVQQLSQSNLSIPVLALNYTSSPSSPNFYQFGLLPEDEIEQIVNRAQQKGLTKALVIAPQNNWGKRLVIAFREHFIASGGSIQDSLFYTKQTNFNQEIAAFLKIDLNQDAKLMHEENDKNLLISQRRQDFDMIFLVAQAKEARMIVPVLRYYYTLNIPIFASANIYSNNLEQTQDVDLDGVTICDIPWHIKQRKENSKQSNQLYAVGQDAYLLSQTVERLKALPYFPIYSKTGALSLTANGQIHRRLPCLTIKHGHLA